MVEREVSAVTLGMVKTMWETQQRAMRLVTSVEGTTGVYCNRMIISAVAAQLKKLHVDLGGQLSNAIMPVYNAPHVQSVGAWRK